MDICQHRFSSVAEPSSLCEWTKTFHQTKIQTWKLPLPSYKVVKTTRVEHILVKLFVNKQRWNFQNIKNQHLSYYSTTILSYDLVWLRYIYLHLLVDRFTSPMDPIGLAVWIVSATGVWDAIRSCTDPTMEDSPFWGGSCSEHPSTRRSWCSMIFTHVAVSKMTIKNKNYCIHRNVSKKIILKITQTFWTSNKFETCCSRTVILRPCLDTITVDDEA